MLKKARGFRRGLEVWGRAVLALHEGLVTFENEVGARYRGHREGSDTLEKGVKNW